MARRPVAFELAEIAGERDLLIVGDVLVPKDQHGKSVHARLDRGDLLRDERPAAIDPLDFTNEHGVDLADRYGHAARLLVPSGA